MICPRCNLRLNKKINENGVLYVCRSCNGRAVALAVVRRTVPQPIVKDLWRKQMSSTDGSGAKCPVCCNKMAIITLSYDSGREHLDVCRKCQFIWFDPHELENLPKVSPKKPPNNELPLEYRKRIATARVRSSVEDRELQNIGVSSPEQWWEYLLGMLGMPVEYNKTSLRETPMCTYTLAFLMVLFTLVSFFDHDTMIMSWGLIPERFERILGLTFISSFFLHGGVVHLLANVYYLIVFGDNVEEILGVRLYLLLVSLSAIVGDLFHIVCDFESATPLVGASGGISGILTYYCLMLPKSQIGLFLGFRWYRIPIFYMLFIWIIYQFAGALNQLSGIGNVSAMAHLGGGLVGIIFRYLHSRSFFSYKGKQLTA